MAPPRIPFVRQALAMQIGLLALVLGAGFGLVWWLLDDALTDQYGQRALAVARSVAATPGLGTEVAAGDPDHSVQPAAERVRVATGALFVVVTDKEGIRLSHPDTTQLGKRVSTDPSQALAGGEVVNVERGTLGLSARGKVPLRDPNGTVVGEVSVGFDAARIDASMRELAQVGALVVGGALALGVAGSVLLTRMLKRRTLGLEPHELAELVQEREAVLHGVDNGVLAVDAGGRVTVCNAEAARLLDLPARLGVPVAALGLPPRLAAALTADEPIDNLLTVAGNRVLIANRREVVRDNRKLGTVLTMRDRTDLEALTRELDSVRAMTDALRAQRHEFANRLHTLSGLLRAGHHTQAAEYLAALTAGPAGGLAGPVDAVRDPYLISFLSAKAAVARERDVELAVGESSWVPGRVIAPLEVTTVLGNLVDNALEAARTGTRHPARVEVDLLAEAGTLHVSVVDTGNGVPASLRERLFVEGVSTKDGEGHGLGLALAAQAARSLGGEVRLADPGGVEHGAVFVAVLPSTLVAEERS
jgi:two-component system CitB family sensor kinase